ncbi:MAG TPA: indole-3-glycerol phosphate synthase TrpC [Longimicrobiales bacterium]|nr:indole-3-glycerol phosphate synthase TrpC [Longimicrobiales bacterium]
MSVLDRIVATKGEEVTRLRRDRQRIMGAAAGAAARGDFEAALRSGPHVRVIAEVKRRSPSAGEIRGQASAADVARVYADAGVACISVLTDGDYFGGALADLETVAAAVDVPLLRKDFTIDELQVYEAKAAGASAVLLIVRILDDVRLREFRELAESLGMAALVEVHDEGELSRATASGARIIGVNNRDLATFETDLAVTERLAGLAPRDAVLVGESGIRQASDVARLAAAGVDAVLVGEALMRAADVAGAAREMGSVRRHQRSGAGRWT